MFKAEVKGRGAVEGGELNEGEFSRDFEGGGRWEGESGEEDSFTQLSLS